MNVPPHAWSDYVVEDAGNASPRAMRATLAYVPCNKEVLKESKLPLAVAVTPLAQPRTWMGEAPVACVDFGQEGPLRCSRCRAYINPHVRWTDGGRSWGCPLCGESNEAPTWYVAPLDQYGLRVDRVTRPELSCGSVEFTVPPSYLREDDGVRRLPAPLAVAFLIDVSLPAITSGLLTSACAAVSAALEVLEGTGEGCARAGIVTFDSRLHFYDVGRDRREVAQVDALDVDDAFCPLGLDAWCPPVGTTKARLQALLERLPSLFPPTLDRAPGGAGASAIKAAVDGLAGTGGRVVAFLASAPAAGEGRLPGRENPRLYGIDKERELLLPTAVGPTATWYSDLARHSAAHGVSVDLLVATPASVDLGTLGQLAFTTGGEVRLYPDFAPPPPGAAPGPGGLLPVLPVPSDVNEKLVQELSSALNRDTGVEAVLKVRASRGLTVARYMGNFSERAESEADLAGVDSDKTMVVTLTHDGNEIRDGEGLFLQAALLYATAGGSRRVRVHTLRLVASESIHDVFRHADIDAILAFLVRKSVQTVLMKEARFVPPDLTEATIDMLYAYRKHCAAHSSSGQLILPESLKLLPLYLSVVTKLPAFTLNKQAGKSLSMGGGRSPFADVAVRADVRLAELIRLSAQPLSSLVPHMYTRMYRVDNLAPGHGVTMPLEIEGGGEAAAPAPAAHYTLTFEQLQRVPLPPSVYPSVEQLMTHCVYLIEHASGLYVHVGAEADERAFADLFGEGVRGPAALAPGADLPVREADLSRQMWTLIAAIRSRRPPYLPLRVLTDGMPGTKDVISAIMVEDKLEGARSYVDLLAHVHTSIQARMAAST